MNILLVCLFTLSIIPVFTKYALAGTLEDIMLMEQYEKEKKLGNLQSAEGITDKITDSNIKNIMYMELAEIAMTLKKCVIAKPLIEKLSDKNIKAILTIEYSGICK